MLQKDLSYCLIKDKHSNLYKELYNVIHCGAYYCLYDVKKYKTKEYIPYARKYSQLIKKYVPNIDSEYPTNINQIYEQFRKDILSSH